MKLQLFTVIFTITCLSFTIIPTYASSNECQYGESVTLNYTMENGKVLKMCFDSEAYNIILNINTKFDGFVTIEIPRSLVNPVLPNCQDDRFTLVVNGEERSYDTIETSEYSRTIRIPVTSADSSIEIIGSVTPEGGRWQIECQKEIQETISNLSLQTTVSTKQIEQIPLKSKQFYHIIQANEPEGLSITGTKSEIETGSFSFFVKSEADNILELQIPLDLITLRSKCKGSIVEEDPFILVDEKEVQKESKTKIQEDSMFLEIPIAKNSQEVEIIITMDPYEWEFPKGCPIKYFKNAIPYSPLKQVQKGIVESEIVCSEDLNLVFKPSDNLPACVKSSTVEKLIYRDWIMFGERAIIVTDKPEYKMGELVTITVKNVGTSDLHMPCIDPYIRIMNEENIQMLERICFEGIGTLHVGSEFQSTWNQINERTGMQAESGKYSIESELGIDSWHKISTNFVINP